MSINISKSSCWLIALFFLIDLLRMNNTILFVEDEPILSKKFKQMFELSGYIVYHFHNGKLALEYLQKENPKIDIVICDIVMPEMDGYAFFEAFKKTGYDAPFIFLTANANMSSMRKGMNLGADDYFAKPVSINDLLKAIRTRIEKNNRIEQTLQTEIDKFRVEIQKRDSILRDIAQNQSHTIREPIAALMAVASMLDPAKMDDDNRKLSSMISPLVEKLDRVIRENTYNINKIEN